MGRGRWRVRLRFEPRDLWVGLYWTHAGDGVDLYVCVVPTVPIVLSRRGER